MTGKDLLIGLGYVDEALLGEVLPGETRLDEALLGEARPEEARQNQSCRAGLKKDSGGFKRDNDGLRLDNDDLRRDSDGLGQDRGIHAARKRRQGRPLRYLGTLAACLCLAAAVIAGTGAFDGKTPVPAEEKTVMVQMADVAVNQLEKSLEGDRMFNMPNSTAVQWTESDIQEYFGRSLTPAYIPEGLQPSKQNGMATVWENQDGELVWDAVRVDYYHAYNADGAPAWTEDAAAEKGFTLTAAKIGIYNDFSWLGPDDQRKITLIEGTDVVIGHRSMDYGPYDEETHEPAGCYDLYTADFQIDGTFYEVVSHQLPLEELVKIVASFIGETEHVVLN